MTLVEAGGAVRRRGRGFQNTGESTNSVFFPPILIISCLVGDNNTKPSADATYDRVESTTSNLDTRAARCKVLQT